MYKLLFTVSVVVLISFSQPAYNAIENSGSFGLDLQLSSPSSTDIPIVAIINPITATCKFT